MFLQSGSRNRTAEQGKPSWATGMTMSDIGWWPGRPGCSPAILKQS